MTHEIVDLQLAARWVATLGAFRPATAGDAEKKIGARFDESVAQSSPSSKIFGRGEWPARPPSRDFGEICSPPHAKFVSFQSASARSAEINKKEI